MKEVTRKEFETFLRNYPKQLKMEISCMSTPATIQYIDTTRGEWPGCVVAHHYEDLRGQILPPGFCSDKEPLYYILDEKSNNGQL